MAQRTKTHRGIKRDNSKIHCYCYHCIGSKKFDHNHNRANDKITVRKELETIEKEYYEFIDQFDREMLNYL